MKKRYLIYRLFFAVIVILITTECKKEEPAKLAIVSTTPVTNITATTATSGGRISSDGGALITASGICWGTAANPATSDSKTTDGAGTGKFVSEITGLTTGLIYHVRAYATNSFGTDYGEDATFTTLGQAPSSLTLPATNVTIEGVTLNGYVNANYVSSDVTFEYGTTISYGSSIIATQSAVTGKVYTNISVDITGLKRVSIYHYRIKSVNSLGTTYGSDMTFTTTYGSVVDVEGNTYYTTPIGAQVWMAENLKTTRYSNGDLIGTTTTAWSDITAEPTPKYQWAFEGGGHTDVESTVATYGRLYTWYAATDSRNVCPTGWHVPSDTEWTTLTNYLGGEEVAGDKLKETGTTHWVSRNTGAANETGFTALPAGYRSFNDNDGVVFSDLGYSGNWWSSTKYSATDAFVRSMNSEGSNVLRYYSSYSDKQGGLSVRCLKD